MRSRFCRQVMMRGTASPRLVIGGFAALALIVVPSALAENKSPKPLQLIEPIADSPFLQEYREPFVMWPQGLQHFSPVAVATDSRGKVWAAGPWGVQYLDDGKWKTPGGESLDGPAFSFAVEGDVVWVAAWDGLYQLKDGKLARAGFEGQPLGVVRLSGKKLLVGGPKGIWERNGEQWDAVPGHYSRSLTDLVAVGDGLWIATQRGLFELLEGNARRIYSLNEVSSGATRALAVGSDGRLWIGSSGGIDVYKGSRRETHIGGAEGLPCTDVWRLKFDPQGTLWVGTARGLGRFDGKRWSWRDSLRWLPTDSVWDIAFGNDNTAYIATTGGLATLKQRKITLAEKAAEYEKLVRARHVRPPGLVEHCILRQPGDLKQHAPTDTDNDGLFTGLYVGAEAYRYAVTGDAQAAEFARESYRAMEYLQTVTETSGFVARTVVPSDWGSVNDRNRTYSPQEVAFEQVVNPRFRRVDERWRKSRDGKWLWKGDTSSDEISGHYFAYGVYYDLVAKEDAKERERVAALVRRVTDHIIDGGFTLRDIDGKPTLWGVWAPEKLNDDPDWQPERGSNSVEILSYLAVANHVTGDEKYLRELEKLFTEKKYSELILEPKLSAPSEFTYIDDQLLAISYRGLLAYDRDPKRRAVYLESIRNWFDVIRRDHSPLYNFVYGGVMGGDFGAIGCVELLRDMPLDMVDWTVDSRHREDVHLVRTPVIEDVQVDRLLPPSERSLSKWDKNPYEAVSGSGGHTESSSVHWLLPYWMGRYYEIIK